MTTKAKFRLKKLKQIENKGRGGAARAQAELSEVKRDKVFVSDTGERSGAAHSEDTAAKRVRKHLPRKPMSAKRKLMLGACIALGTLCVATLLWGQDVLDAWQARQTSAMLDGLYQTPEPIVTQVSVEALATAFTPSPTPSPSPDRDATPTPEPVPTPMPIPTTPPIHEDFQALYEQNQHLIGWLRLGEDTDAPVVYYDNDYYLHHDYFGRDSKNGVLFLNANNKLYPRDDVWLIHGHNMASGAMFGKLGKYRNEDYVQQYPIVMFRTVYDAEEIYYAPVAAFDASMMRSASGYFDITQMLFESDEEAAAREAAERGETPAPTSTPSAMEGETSRHSAAYQRYLDELREWSYWQSPMDVNVDDELLMLVTCSYNHTDGRFMLVCRKLREDENPQDIAALYQPEEKEGGVP